MKLKAKLPLIIREGTYVFEPDGKITLVQSEEDRNIIIHGPSEDKQDEGCRAQGLCNIRGKADMKLEGWFTYVEDVEYGPTLLRYIGEGKPTKEPNTFSHCLNDPDWEQVFFFEKWREDFEPYEYKWMPHNLVFTVVAKEGQDSGDKPT